jgi:hypothetical protein
MKICKDCMEKEYETQEEKDLPFPAFTIVGGLFCSAATLLIGSLVLIPVGLLAGAATDIARCEICGSKDDNLYETMNSEEDEEGRIYSPMDSMGGAGDSGSFGTPEPISSPKVRYRYDEVQEKLTPIETENSFTKPDSGKSAFDWSISPGQSKEKSPDVADQVIRESVLSVQKEDVKAPEENVKGVEGVKPGIPSDPKENIKVGKGIRPDIPSVPGAVEGPEGGKTDGPSSAGGEG